MTATRRLDRRTFVVDLGRGALALAVLGIAGCAPSALATARPSGSGAPAASGGTGSPASTSPASTASPTGGPASSPMASDTASSGPGALAWHRVDLGFVSAYVLVRGGEAAVVDTGVAGSEDAIEAALTAAGLGWLDVGHVILTHHHADHAGSAAAVLERAPDATAYAGAEDIAAIAVPRALAQVQDGDRVFDLQVVTAPGHTAGSICVLDTAAGVLVAGDALRTADGRPVLPEGQFTADLDQATASVAKLGGLTFGTLLVGHGDPIEGNASAMVAELAAQA